MSMLNENISKSKGIISKWFLLIGGSIILVGIIGGAIYFKGEREITMPKIKPFLPSIGEEVIVGNAKWKIIEVKDRGNILKGYETSSCKSHTEWFKKSYGWKDFTDEEIIKEDFEKVKVICSGKWDYEKEWCERDLKELQESPECKDIITGGRFIEVIMTIENLGDIRAGVGRVTLIDVEGREYDFHPTAQEVLPKDRIFGSCAPILTSHQTREVAGIYEIPKNITGLKAEVSELIPEPKCDPYMLSWEFERRVPFEVEKALISLEVPEI